ncbi:putative enterotoxin [Ophiocordyceps unilateralis]|uniref:Enterotoxin n=1 Tax=Ophiocordyceps unilateralis TaxID=268505 RepID=A0A2A9PT65_OPHUN|nr:putative enterotoxin [Ophiocordyceps unilateralis]
MLSHRLSPLVALVFLFFGTCDPASPPGQSSDYVFRSDKRSPSEIEAAGGFYPHSETNYTNPRAYSLESHVNGRDYAAYVSTSRSFDAAVAFEDDADRFIYRIRITPNMIDLDGVPFTHPYGQQMEISALGGIPWSATQAWMEVQASNGELGSGSEFGSGSGSGSGFQNSFSLEQFEQGCTENPIYVSQGHLGVTAQTVMTDSDAAILAAQHPGPATMAAAIRFMNNHGSTVGWETDQQFPLRPLPLPIPTGTGETFPYNVWRAEEGSGGTPIPHQEVGAAIDSDGRQNLVEW